MLHAFYYDSGIDNPLDGTESEASNGDESDGCDNEGLLSMNDDVDAEIGMSSGSCADLLGMDLASLLDTLS